MLFAAPPVLDAARVIREEPLSLFQKDLYTLMGELATDSADMPRYLRDGFPVVSPDMTSRLDREVGDLEARHITFRGWATPGGTLNSAALDLARTACRRAERRVCAIPETGQTLNPEVLVYLNRLSDLLWLLARWAEGPQSSEPKTVA